MKTVQDMHQHVIDLCAKHDIAYGWCPISVGGMGVV
jgi:hypothetical protein